jgi:hypothetical protein
VSHQLKRVLPAFGPLLFAVFPVMSLFAQNQHELDLSLLWPPIAICAGAAAVVFGLLLLTTRRTANAAVMASLVVVAFLYYGVFFDQQPVWFVVPWLALFSGALVAVWQTKRDLANVAVILAIAALAMAAPQAVNLARYHAAHPAVAAADPRLWPTTLELPAVATGTTLPDIFVIIPDDYARSDNLKRYFGYDDGGFVAQLKQRGFVMSEQSRSPYSYSEMNIAALLNMDYLTNWPEVLGRESEDFNSVKRVMDDNRAARLLTSVGYDYLHIDTDEVTFSGGNPGISRFAAPDSFSNLWPAKTILGQVGGPFGFSDQAINQRFRTSIRSEFSELRALPAGTKPRFVVFHTLLPHDPYIFDASGEPVTFPADADHTGRAGMEYYVSQLQFLQSELLTSIDQILASATTPPVIILQADEGFEVNPEVFGETATQEIRLKGLGAFYLPGLENPSAPSPPNSVNSLRFVFNRYLGTNYEMLDSVSHIEGELPFDFNEVPVK